MSQIHHPARCPRCRGRLEQNRDRYGVYLSCFMCGYVREITSPAALDLTALLEREDGNQPLPKLSA